MASNSKILEEAEWKIEQFDLNGLHYNLVADQVYRKRFKEKVDPFGKEYLRHIVAGLVAFDMAKLMGKRPYDTESKFFASRLEAKIFSLKPLLEALMNLSLTRINLKTQKSGIMKAFEYLSADGEGALHQNKNKHFYVGATKILHFLNPILFIIIDSNASRAYKLAHGVNFVKATQPGFSAEKYIQCMECARNDIVCYGPKRFQKLDANIPITTIYDKLTFVTGGGINQSARL